MKRYLCYILPIILTIGMSGGCQPNDLLYKTTPNQQQEKNEGIRFFEKLSNGIVRVYTGDNYGTGSFIEEHKDYYIVLTAAHVLKQHTKCDIDLFLNGRPLRRIKNLDVDVNHFDYNNEGIDIGTIIVPKKNLNGFIPLVIPLASENFALHKGDLVYTMGFPSAECQMFYPTYITDIDSDHNWILNTEANPIGGQSGSLIIKDINGKQFGVGLIDRRTVADVKKNGRTYPGYAITHTKIKEILYQSKKNSERK